METTIEEQVLDALESQLQLNMRDVEVLRNSAVPEDVPAGGLVNILDGDPGDPIEVLGGFRDTGYSRAIQIELYVAHGDRKVRDKAFAALGAALGAAIESDLTLGGTVSGISYGKPAPATEPVEGGHDIKSGTVTVTVDYLATSPLG